MDRQTLRKQKLAARDRLSLEEIQTRSAVIVSQVLKLPETVNANTFFTYLPFRSEVQTTDLVHKILAAEKEVCVPLTMVKDSQLLAVKITDVEKQTAPGYCGIPEPVSETIPSQTIDPATIDIVIVPGSVFDRTGGRLGYGGGYYDRFLINLAPQAVRIGVAFALQMADVVPVEPHDQRMDYIVTEAKTYDCRSYRYAQNSSVQK